MRRCEVIMRPQSSIRGLDVVSFLAIAAGGCGPASSLTLVPVEGRVTLDGKPVPGCIVTFEPADQHAATGPQAVGVADKDGWFRVRSSGNRLGAVPGVHRVFVAPTDVVSAAGESRPAAQHPEATASPDLVPPRYQSPGTSGLEATVVAEGKNSFVFELHSKTK